jgi:predicted phosphodiesterase
VKDEFENWLSRNGLTKKDVKRLVHSVRNYQARRAGVFHHDFDGKRIRIGVISDTHFGNKWTDKAFLHDVMQRFKVEGVEAVYHVGDVTDGPWQRHNNVLEQYAHGYEAQTKDFIKDFPDIGKRTYLITGNHDDWYYKMGSGDVGARIQESRKDITNLGRNEALVKLGGVEILLSHPDRGSAYAYSYHPQKFVESMFKMQEPVPDIILQGHYHKIFQMHFGGTAFFSTGTTCRQTPWMRGKNISADLGAWMLDIYRDSHKRLTKIVSVLLPYKGDRHSPVIE